VVDDDVNVRELLEQILDSEGHQVTTAANGNEALRILEQRDFDLVITDIKMPETDGVAFYELIRHKHPELRSRVVFVTGDLMGASTLRFLDSTGSPWVGKPFEIRTLRETINRMLRQKGLART